MDEQEGGAGDADRLETLLGSAARGDERAWRELVGLYGRRVFALARSRCRDTQVAEDITQSVFMTVAAKVGNGEYEEHGRFEAWLFRVAMNRIRDHVRRVRRSPQMSGSLETKTAEGYGDTGDGEQLARLREAMEMLSDADREIVEMRHHGGMSFKRMSEVLDEPLGTLLARHHRALRKLRELMEETPRKEGRALA